MTRSCSLPFSLPSHCRTCGASCTLLFVSRAVALEKGGGLQAGASSAFARTYVGFSLQIRCHVLTPVPAAYVPNFFRQALPRMAPILRELMRVTQDLDNLENPLRPWRDLRWVLAKLRPRLNLPLTFRFVPYLEAACHDVNGKLDGHRWYSLPKQAERPRRPSLVKGFWSSRSHHHPKSLKM